MWIPLLRVTEKENKIREKAKVSRKGKTIGLVSTRVLGINSHQISSHRKRIQMIPRVKAKVRKAKTKGKGEGDQGKSRKVANVESDGWAQE